MFTGIVEELGRVAGIRKTGTVTRVSIEADLILEGTRPGDSVSVDGVCLTVVAVEGRVLSFEAVTETMNRSTLGRRRAGDRVNLERALKVGDRLGGHFVTGHVDGVGVVRSKQRGRGNLEFWIGLPPSLLKWVVPKGSVAVDGVSLTVAGVRSGGFLVSIVPHTAGVTTLGARQAGDRVNIECDVLVKRPTI